MAFLVAYECSVECPKVDSEDISVCVYFLLDIIDVLVRVLVILFKNDNIIIKDYLQLMGIQPV